MKISNNYSFKYDADLSKRIVKYAQLHMHQMAKRMKMLTEFK